MHDTFETLAKLRLFFIKKMKFINLRHTVKG